MFDAPTTAPREDFWSSLSGDDARDLQARGTVRAYRRGETLVHERQVADRVLVMRRGHVKITALTSNSREVVLAFRGPGDLVADLAALDGQPRSATIRAVEPVEALVLSANDFREFVVNRPEVSLAVIRLLIRRLREADLKRVEFAGLTTIERVAARLLEFAERFGLQDAEGATLIALPLSQDELAGATGASLESVGRALQTMRGLGYIETRRREIRILDARGLGSLTPTI